MIALYNFAKEEDDGRITHWFPNKDYVNRTIRNDTIDDVAIKIVRNTTVTEYGDTYYQELLTGEKLCKLFFDLDYLDKPVIETIDIVKQEYEKLLNIKITNIAYSTSDNYKGKIHGYTSHHVIFPEYACTCNEQRYIALDLMAILGEMKEYKGRHVLKEDKNAKPDGPKYKSVPTDILDGAVYPNNGAYRWFRQINQPKPYETEHQTDFGIHRITQGKVTDFVLQYTTGCKIINYAIPDNGVKANRINKKVPSGKPVQTTYNSDDYTTLEGIQVIDKEYVRELLALLDAKKRNSQGEWKDIMLFLKNQGYIDIAHEYSSQPENRYNYNPKTITQMFANKKPYPGCSKYMIEKKAIEDNPDKYKELQEKWNKKIFADCEKPLTYDDIYDDYLLFEHMKHVSMTENTDRITDQAILRMEEHMNKPTGKQTLLIQASTGCGKTYYVKNHIIDKIKSLDETHPLYEARILSITSVRSLAMAQKNDYELMCYLSNDDDCKDDKIDPELLACECNGGFIISLEQLYKLDKRYDIIILDEVTSLLGHIGSPTMKHKRESYDKLLSILACADLVVALDAIIDDNVYNFINCARMGFQPKMIEDMHTVMDTDICDNTGLFFYRNVYKRWEHVDVQIFKTDDQNEPSDKSTYIDRMSQMLEPIRQRVINCESCCIFSDSKKYIILVEQIIRRMICDMTKDDIAKCIKILCEHHYGAYYINNADPYIEYYKNYIGVFTSNTGNIANINSFHFRNRCILFSPKIIYGVNIDKSVKYATDSLYGIYSGTSISSYQMLQQIGRFRGATGRINILFTTQKYAEKKNTYIPYEWHVYSRIKALNSYLNIQHKLNPKLTIIQELGCVYNDESNGFTVKKDSIYMEYYFRSTWFKSMFENNKLETLESLLTYYGYKVSCETIVTPPHDNVKYKSTDNPKMIEDCTKYINGVLPREYDNFLLIERKVTDRMMYLGITDVPEILNGLKSDDEDVRMVHAIKVRLLTSEKDYIGAVHAQELLSDEETLREMYASYDLIEATTTYKNPALLNMITLIEKAGKFNRFDFIEPLYVDEKSVKECIIENEELMKCAICGFNPQSTSYKDKQYKKCIEELNKGNIREIIYTLYNKYSKLFKKKQHWEKQSDGSRKHLSTIIENTDVLRNATYVRFILERNKDQRRHRCRVIQQADLDCFIDVDDDDSFNDVGEDDSPDD